MDKQHKCKKTFFTIFIYFMKTRFKRFLFSERFFIF